MSLAYQQELQRFYAKLVVDTANGLQKKICEANGIPLEPKNAAEMRAIPVFEQGAPASLLQSANDMRRPTEIIWAVNPSHQFLPAYFKTYRDLGNGRLRSQIVVSTENYCVARFVAAKELMHCFLDEDGVAATNTMPLVHALIDDLLVEKAFASESPQTIVDQIAWLGAGLYLIPDSWIPCLEKARDAIAARYQGINANLTLAQLIRVPEIILKARLRHFGTWSRGTTDAGTPASS